MSGAPALKPAAGLQGGVLAQLPERSGEPAWLAARREAAVTSLSTAGLPDSTQEAWRYTPVRQLNTLEYVTARAGEHGAATKARLLDGVPELTAVPAGVELARISDVLRDAPARLEPYLGSLSARSDGYVAANTASFQDGLCVFVGAGQHVLEPLSLLVQSLAAEQPTMRFPRLLIVLEPNSRLFLAETHEGRTGAAQLSSMVSEIFVGENASLELVRVVHGDAAVASLSHDFIELAAHSHAVLRSFTFGGLLSRSDVDVCFRGPGAEATLDGLYLGSHDEHVEHHVLVDHCASHCTSHQKFKGVLAGRARGVFDGTIVVAKDTKATVAHQENRNILLSDEAVVHTKPHLQIDADDVKCSHGATVGRLDAQQLFYLRSRGIGKADAHAVLTLAFAKEMTDRVTDAALCEALASAVVNWQPRPAGLEDFS